MGRAPGDFGGLFLNFMIVGMVAMIAIIFSYVALIAIPAYVGYRLYKESPKRLERLAREETEILYNHARAGSVRLTDVEIEVALARHWPPDLPTATRIQLLQIGKAIFEQEGLMPDVPPLPALCNTVARPATAGGPPGAW